MTKEKMASLGASQILSWGVGTLVSS